MYQQDCPPRSCFTSFVPVPVPGHPHRPPSTSVSTRRSRLPTRSTTRFSPRLGTQVGTQLLTTQVLPRIIDLCLEAKQTQFPISSTGSGTPDRGDLRRTQHGPEQAQFTTSPTLVEPLVDPARRLAFAQFTPWPVPSFVDLFTGTLRPVEPPSSSSGLLSFASVSLCLDQP